MGIIRDIRTDLELSALELLREYHARLYADALKLCNDPTFSEDLVMQTISEVCRDKNGFDAKKGEFYAWMHGILEHLHARSKRRLVTRGTTPVDPEILATDENLVTNETDDRILTNSDNDALRKAVERLPPAYRQAVLMHYFSELPIKDIALLAKVPVGTICWRLNVARKMLAKDLADKLGRKPVAVLLAVLLGIGTLFGAWQAGVAMIEAMSDDGRAVSTKPPITENNQIPLTTTTEDPQMNTIKGTLLTAATAVSLMSTAQVGEPIPVTPETIVSLNAGTVGRVGDDFVLSFTNTASTYTFTIPNGVEAIRYLVVGGGGSGGWNVGGGGGAGGFLTAENISVASGDVLAIKVGAGGLAPTSAAVGNSGENSSLTNVTDGSIQLLAYGGGGGGCGWGGGAPLSGGSGGGGSGCYSGSVVAYSGAPAIETTPSQGSAGGGSYYESVSYTSGGGGGGAGAPGGSSSATGNSNARGGNGGDGRSSDITGGDPLYYAAGGGGAQCASKGDNVGKGGSNGVGGNGGYNNNGDYTAGTGMDGRGGGGGGGGYRGDGRSRPGAGGSGIVIIRYTPPASKRSTVHFSHDSNTATYVATAFGNEVKEGDEVDVGTSITVVATPIADYEYEPTPADWTKEGEESITATFTTAGDVCTILIPAATAIPFTMNFTPGANASYTATVDGQPVQNGDKIRTGKQIVVVATPNTDCEYTAIPPDWSAGEVEGTITRTITAGEGVPQLTIPDAAAIDYVPVQFTSNGSAFYEATNAVGEKVEGRVRAGTEVFVKIWAGVGFVYTETPTGWTWEAEGDAYTKVFAAVLGSTLTIQIPNATEIAGKWTKEIPAAVGYKLELEKELVYVFTNTAATGHAMILPSSITSLRYLVVGAGGSGGGRHGGGGGAGGMLTNNDFKVVGRTLKITVGAGGERVISGGNAGGGKRGGDSVLVNGAIQVCAGGGGGGASQAGEPAEESGVGGCTGGASEAGKAGSGGAGAKESGVAGVNRQGGKGGDGLESDIIGKSICYAGGGGGANNSSGDKDISHCGAGGADGGGRGGYYADGGSGLDGVDGLGGGGGGCGYRGNSNEHSGKGGDGVVILRFAKPKGGVIIFLM